MDRTLICIGGGELKSKETLKIDEYIANKARERAVGKRPYGLFIPTASHDSMPYFNSFRKTYTSVFDIKADVALTIYGEMSAEKLRDKFEKADFLYVGGGDTVFMLEHWKKSGMLDLIKEAYERGVIVCGLSAGAICWFEEMYTDSPEVRKDESYAIFPGLNWIKGIISPHYGQRMLDFDKIVCYNYQCAYGVEDNAALLIENEIIAGSLSSGGKAYRLVNKNGALEKHEVV